MSVLEDPYFEPPDSGVLPTLNGATGKLLENVPLPRMYRVLRRKFRTFLHARYQH